MNLYVIRRPSAWASAAELDTVAARSAGFLRRLARRLWRAMEINRRRQLLAQMPDFMLKDIGINRADIDSIVEALVDGREDPTRLPRRGPGN